MPSSNLTSSSLFSPFGLYSHPHYSLSSDGQWDSRAVPPPAEDLSTRRRRSRELDGSLFSESHLEKDLATCSHDYLRCDLVRRLLKPPYDGPFRVISRETKSIRIQRETREEVVSVDRLKAAVRTLLRTGFVVLYTLLPSPPSSLTSATPNCNYPPRQPLTL
ncbi:hypothetical protein SprV_0100419200 [Sparganum proliferum]